MTSTRIFVAYPYSFPASYREALARALPSPDFTLEYADERIVSGHVLDKIQTMLDSCDLAVFDLTNSNANVYLELGIALAAPHPCIVALDATAVAHLKADVQGWDQLRYASYDDLGKQIRDRIQRKSVPTRHVVTAQHRNRSKLHYDLDFVEDAAFYEKATSLMPEEGQTIKAYGRSVVSFDATLNLRLNSAKTLLNVRDRPYRLPTLLLEYFKLVIQRRNPYANEDKIRLCTSLTRETLTSRQGVDVQQTNYHNGLATNELAANKLLRTHFEDGTEELVCSIFCNYVGDRKLIALSDSELSNHIGVTTIVITSDDYLYLQRQGETQFEPRKIMVGASGSADWNDIERSPDVVDHMGRSRKSLQEVVKYAVEREAAEELWVTTGPGQSKTTLTGFARYIQRGGKPEFFFVTYLQQRFADIPPEIRKEEERWVRRKLDRRIPDDSIEGLLHALDHLVSEFQVAGDATTSMMVAVDFAKYFLQNSGLSIADLRP